MIQRNSSSEVPTALGVSVVIGALLILTVVIIAAAQYQTQVIPVQEEETEIEHNRLIRGQMAELNNEMQGSSNSGDLRTQQLQLGTAFEGQIIFGIIPAINQPSPAGDLEFEDAEADIQIENAQGIAESRNYWDDSNEWSEGVGDVGGFLTYEPDYRHFQDAPQTHIENGMVIDYYEDSDVYQPQSDQNLINNNNINLSTFTSDINMNTIGVRTIEAHPVSAPAQTITIEPNESNDPLEISVPTKLDQETWDSLLEDEVNTGNVEEVDVENNTLTLDLAGGDNVYTLTMSRVHLTTRESAGQIPVEDEEYIAWDADALVIDEASRNQIDAQVRDRFNNPVIGVETQAVATDTQTGDCIGNFDISDDDSSICPGLDQPGIQTSADNGNLRFIYEAPEVDEDTSIDITIDFADDD